jgi:hypothetical protein
MEIKRTISQYRDVGFECDMCRKKYRTDDFYREENWPLSNKGSLNMFRNKNHEDPDEPPTDEFVDLCEKCFQKVVCFVTTHGGRINTFD